MPGQETLIEIDKGGLGLGLSIVGGSDTVLGSVVIHEVYSDGAAAKDGRLEPGDQVLEVCFRFFIDFYWFFLNFEFIDFLLLYNFSRCDFWIFISYLIFY